MTALELTHRDISRDRDRDRLHAWLRAHGLDPKQTAPGLVVRDGRVTATVYVVDEHGIRQSIRDPYTGAFIGVRTTVVEVPLAEPVPDGLGREIP